MTDGANVAAVRAFNRFYASLIGVLEEGLLQGAYSLTEARVIFELAQRPTTEVAELRRELNVDAGYLSRILTRFAADGIVSRERSASDGRRQVIRLTERGRADFHVLDARSSAEVDALLSRLSGQDQTRLVGAMRQIRQLLEPAPGLQPFILREPQPGDLGWVIHRHGALYAQEYGWDDTFEALVARIVADYAASSDRSGQRAWIAELEGQPVGCVFCVRNQENVAQLRLLLVEPSARGTGLGGRLVAECVDFARASGYREIVLWTNEVLHEARRIYERAGFELRDEEPHHSFGHDLVGQTWSRTL